MKNFNFNVRTEYEPEAKRRWHSHARKRLDMLAKLMGLRPGEYDVRSCLGGIAVGGEAILHSDIFYIQVASGDRFGMNSILIRTCNGRKDYSGGPNQFAPLSLMNDLPGFAIRIGRMVPAARELPGMKGIFTE